MVFGAYSSDLAVYVMSRSHEPLSLQRLGVYEGGKRKDVLEQTDTSITAGRPDDEDTTAVVAVPEYGIAGALGVSCACVFNARYILLSVLNTSIARKCGSGTRPTSTPWIALLVLTPNVSVTRTCCPDNVTSASVRSTFPQLAAVAEEHVRLRRVVRLHEHVLRTAVAPFTMKMCAPSSGSRCPTPFALVLCLKTGVNVLKRLPRERRPYENKALRVEGSKFSSFSSPVCLILLMIDTAVTWKAFLPCLHRVANNSDLRSRVFTPSCNGHAAVTCSVSGPPEEYTMI